MSHIRPYALLVATTISGMQCTAESVAACSGASCVAKKTKAQLEAELDAKDVMLASFCAASAALMDAYDHPANVLVITDGTGVSPARERLQELIDEITGA